MERAQEALRLAIGFELLEAVTAAAANLRFPLDNLRALRTRLASARIKPFGNVEFAPHQAEGDSNKKWRVEVGCDRDDDSVGTQSHDPVADLPQVDGAHEASIAAICSFRLTKTGRLE